MANALNLLKVGKSGGSLAPSGGGPFVNKIWTDSTSWDDATFWID